MKERYIETTIDSFNFEKMKYQSNRCRELLAEGKYKGYKFYIYNLGTHPTAYIEIPNNSKLYGKSIGEVDISVHGGITYAESELVDLKDNWFIGWDYAHFGDYLGYEEMYPNELQTDGKKWTAKEILEEVFNAIDQIIEIEKDVE